MEYILDSMYSNIPAHFIETRIQEIDRFHNENAKNCHFLESIFKQLREIGQEIDTPY